MLKNPRSMCLCIFICILGISGVGLGAIGKHILSHSLSDKDLSTFSTGVTYHQLYSIVLLVLDISRHHLSGPYQIRFYTMIIFLLGLTLFSGSLYLYVFTHISWLVFITPIGGFLLMLGWGALLLNQFTNRIAPKN